MPQLVSTYTPPPSGEIDLLIRLYKEGSSHAANKLIDMFLPYIRKWVRLLSTGYWDTRDLEIRRFLYLSGRSDPSTTAQSLKLKLRAYESEDIRQEVIVAFLECLLKYGHLTKYFRYVLKKRVAILVRDPLVFNYGSNISTIDSPLVASKDEDIDEAWIEGLTGSEVFDNLSQRDRRILYLVKWAGFTIENAAKQMGVSVSTVNRALKKIRVLLKVETLDKPKPNSS